MNILRRLASDKSGNFGLLTAFALVPLIGTAGMAVDFGSAISLRHDLMGIADAAALGAISQGSQGHKAVQNMKQDGQVTIAEDEGRRLFLAQRAGGNLNLSELPLDVSMTVFKAGETVNSVATFRVQMPTTFLRILGKNTITVSGKASAAYGSYGKSYTDFYMLLDNTPSMGIAATTSEIQRMKQLTGANGGRPCAFACHTGRYSSDGQFIESKNTYNVAKTNSVTLRIDVVAEAAAALIKKITSQMASSVDQYRVAAYSFGKYALEPGYRIERLSGLTVDMASASKATGDVALMTTNHDRYNQGALTSFDTALTAIGKEITGNGGTGASAADAKKIVYFVTDGVADSLKPGGDCAGKWYEKLGRCLEPIDVSYCTALKDRNISIAVLYTTYIPLDGDHIWEVYIKNVFADRIASSLRECASPDLFFEVGPNDDMAAAMVKLFVQSTGGATGLRLTH